MWKLDAALLPYQYTTIRWWPTRRLVILGRWMGVTTADWASGLQHGPVPWRSAAENAVQLLKQVTKPCGQPFLHLPLPLCCNLL